MVVPPDTQEGAGDLATEAERAGARVVVADPPPADMRASIEHGLDRLEREPTPDTLLIAPGDSPGIVAELVARVVAQARADPRAIIVPSSQGRRGHPIALPWSLSAEIRDLPDDVGVNALIARHAGRVVEIDVDHPDSLADLDTPEDYRRWADIGPGRGCLDEAPKRHEDVEEA